MNNVNQKMNAFAETKNFIDGLIAEDQANELRIKLENVSIEQIESCENDKELIELVGDDNLVLALAKTYENNTKRPRGMTNSELALQYNKNRLEFMKDYLCYFKYTEDALKEISNEEEKIEVEKQKFNDEVKELIKNQNIDRESIEKSEDNDFKAMLRALETVENFTYLDSKLKSKGVKVLKKECTRHLKHLITKYIKILTNGTNNKNTISLYKCVIYTMINNFAKGRTEKDKQAFEIVLYTFLKEIAATKQVTQQKVMLSNVFILALKHLQDNQPSKIIDMTKFKENLDKNVAIISSQL